MSSKLRTYQALNMNRRMNGSSSSNSRGGIATYARSPNRDASPPAEDIDESAAIKAIRPLYRLSAILGHFPSCFNATTRRLTAASKHMHELDVTNLSQKVVQSTSALLLSNNSIRSLSGVSSFRGLVTLSLSDNLIDDWRELETELSQLPFLSHLTLAGNPLELMAYYRLRVINICSPSLESLDGLPVNKNEVGIAPKVLSAHQTMMDKVLLQNECRLYELAWLVRIQAVHRSLFRHMWGPTSADDVDDVTHLPSIKRGNGSWGGGRAPRVNAGGSYPPEASPLKLSILIASLDNLYPTLTAEARYRIQKQLEQKARANLVSSSSTSTEDKVGRGRVLGEKSSGVHETSSKSVTLLTVDISSLPAATRNACVSWGRALGSLASIQAVLLTELSVMLEDATVRRSEQLSALQRRDPFGRLRAEEEDAERRKMDHENDIYNTKEAFRLKAKATADRNSILEAAASVTNRHLSPTRVSSNAPPLSSRTPASSLVSKVLTPAVHAQLQGQLDEAGRLGLENNRRNDQFSGTTRKDFPSPAHQKTELQTNNGRVSSPLAIPPPLRHSSPPPLRQHQQQQQVNNARTVTVVSPSLSVSAAVNDAIKKSEDLLKIAAAAEANFPSPHLANSQKSPPPPPTINPSAKDSNVARNNSASGTAIIQNVGAFSLSSTSDEDADSPRHKQSDKGSVGGRMSIAYSTTLEQAFAPTPEGSDISPDLNVLKRGHPTVHHRHLPHPPQRPSTVRKGAISSSRRLSKTTTASYRAKQQSSIAIESDFDDTDNDSGSGRGSESGDAVFDFAVNKVLKKILSTAPRREGGDNGGASKQSMVTVPSTVSKQTALSSTSKELPVLLSPLSRLGQGELLLPTAQMIQLQSIPFQSTSMPSSSNATVVEDPRIDQLTVMVKELADKLETLLSTPAVNQNAVNQTGPLIPKIATEAIYSPPSSTNTAQSAPIIGPDLLAELLASQRASVSALLRIEKDLDERRRREESSSLNAISAAITAVTAVVAKTSEETAANDKLHVASHENVSTTPTVASTSSSVETKETKIRASPRPTALLPYSSPSLPTPTVVTFPPSTYENPDEAVSTFFQPEDNRLLIETSMALSESMMMSSLNPLQDEAAQMRHTYPLSLAHDGGLVSSIEDRSEGSSHSGGGGLTTSEILAVSGSGDSGGLFLQRSGGSGSNEAGLSLESALGDDEEEEEDIWRGEDDEIVSTKVRATAVGELQSPDDSFIAIPHSTDQYRSFGKLLPSQTRHSRMEGQAQVNLERKQSAISLFGSKPRSASRGSTDSAQGSALPRRNSVGVMALTESAAARIASTSRSNSRNSARPPSRAGSVGTASGEVDAQKAPWKPR